jgi:uncharacterized peroxidase-related enzyme
MVRDDERRARASEAPIVGSLPDVPGILAAMHLSPGLALHLRGLADELLVKDYAGATLTRAERELLATAVSAGNDCFYCMDTHGAFAGELLARTQPELRPVIDTIKAGGSDGLSDKMRALVVIARTVGKHGRQLGRGDVERALSAGATDADTQLTVMIAAGFSMYNRMVDGMRARTPATDEAYRARAVEIADHGYSDPRVTSVPG